MSEPHTTTIRTVDADESFKSDEYSVKVLHDTGIIVRAKDGSHESFFPIHNVVKVTEFPARGEE